MELIEYLEDIEVPNGLIKQQGNASALFLRSGVYTFWEAIIAVQRLPYERTTDPRNYMQVLKEQRGTCSGKHALIAALAQEMGIPLKLYIGIFFLTRDNTPEIALLLEEFQLEAIPEAHAYLKYKERALDITFPDSVSFSFDRDLEEEWEIDPGQIGTFKEKKHQEFIRGWADQIPFETIWKAREQWIQRLRK